MAPADLASSLLGLVPEPGLLALDLVDDGRTIRRHRRHGGGTVTDTVPFSPFLLVADRAPLDGGGGVTEVTALEGPGALRWLVRFDGWGSALRARDRCRETTGPPPGLWFAGDPVHQYLLLSGRTCFGGMRFADLRRMALDIEVVTTDGFDFPSAARPGDRIIAVALADSTGFRHVVRGDELEETALIEECGRIIRARDPDVIEGHNIFRFDLEYLEARARRHGLALAWGRDGGVLHGRLSRLSIAERTIGYRRYEIPGRHVVDTWMLAQLHDAGARDLPSFGLKDLARHFGVAAPERTYVDAGSISRLFRETPDRLMAYAADDAVETLALSAILSPPYFTQAQLVPFDYQSTALRGAAAKIDALLLREYLRRRHAVPLPGAPRAVGGGHTAIFQQGVARPVLHVDVTSLYPSVMLLHGIAPESDALGVFPALLRNLTEFRICAKREARAAADPDERSHLAALQQAFKILINAFYGYLAYGSGHWNDFAAADRVTAEGRRVVTTILDRLSALGAVPVEVDTDGVYFVPPPGDDPERLLGRIAEGLPAGIQIELDGRYAAMFSYKMKNYAVLDEHGRLTLKGSGFRSRGLEPFQRQIIEEIVRLLLEDRARDAKGVIDRWLGDFAAHRVPLRLFTRTETLQETLETYRERVRGALRQPSACYELALASGRSFTPGDQVAYYVAGRGLASPVSGSARLASDWEAARPDENVQYYQAKVQEIWTRFRPFVNLEGLRPYAEAAEADAAQLSLF